MSELEIAGHRFGTAIGHYLHWLAQNCIQNGHERLFFLSREGAWLAKHYEQLRRLQPADCGWPVGIHLAVSRRSTLLASLPDLTPASLAPFLAQYRGASVATVLDSLGLRENLGADLPLTSPWQAPGVAEAVLNRPEVKDALTTLQTQQRTLLIDYLADHGAMAGSSFAVADVGWRGTIQDHLARALPNATLHGYYLALFPALAEQPSNGVKSGFVTTPRSPQKILRRMRFVAPLEFLCSDETLSVVGYRREGTKSVAVFDEMVIVPVDNVQFNRIQSAISAGVVSAQHLASPQIEYARSQLMDIMENPPNSLIALYFQAWRDDRYGAGVLRRDAPTITLGLLTKALISGSARRALGQAIAGSGWPWAILKRDFPHIAPVLRSIILVTDAKL